MRLGRLLFLAALGGAAALLLRAVVGEPIWIASPSMEPTLAVGDHVLLDKLTLRLRSPRRGEIVSFTPPVPEGRGSVKRVVGLPGDTVELKDKRVRVNGEPLEEPYVQYTRPDERLEGDNLGPWVVPPGHYFLLGDNRDESRDSTSWKDPKTGEPLPFVPESEILGVVRGIY